MTTTEIIIPIIYIFTIMSIIPMATFVSCGEIYVKTSGKTGGIKHFDDCFWNRQERPMNSRNLKICYSQLFLQSFETNFSSPMCTVSPNRHVKPRPGWPRVGWTLPRGCPARRAPKEWGPGVGRGSQQPRMTTTAGRLLVMQKSCSNWKT